jgi:hypothetical protein
MLVNEGLMRESPLPYFRSKRVAPRVWVLRDLLRDAFRRSDVGRSLWPRGSTAAPIPTATRANLRAWFFLNGPFGRRESFETLVRNRLAAFDREAVGAGGKSGLGSLDGSEFFA